MLAKYNPSSHKNIKPGKIQQLVHSRDNILDNRPKRGYSVTNHTSQKFISNINNDVIDFRDKQTKMMKAFDNFAGDIFQNVNKIFSSFGETFEEMQPFRQTKNHFDNMFEFSNSKLLYFINYIIYQVIN